MRVSELEPRAGELNLERDVAIPELDEITLRNQTDSPFLRLPGEIRNRIYSYALGGHQIYAMTGGYRKGYTLMAKPMDSLPWKLDPISQIFAINLPHVCRQVYFETNLLMFELNSFGTVLMDGLVPLTKGFSDAQRKIVKEIKLPLSDSWNKGNIPSRDSVPLTMYTGLKRIVIRTFASTDAIYRMEEGQITARICRLANNQAVEVAFEYL